MSRKSKGFATLCDPLTSSFWLRSFGGSGSVEWVSACVPGTSICINELLVIKWNLPLHYKRHPLPRFGNELLALNTPPASGTTKRPPQIGVPGVFQHGVHIMAEAPSILRFFVLVTECRFRCIFLQTSCMIVTTE